MRHFDGSGKMRDESIAPQCRRLMMMRTGDALCAACAARCGSAASADSSCAPRRIRVRNVHDLNFACFVTKAGANARSGTHDSGWATWRRSNISRAVTG